MREPVDKLSIMDVLSTLWQGKVTILVIALIIALGGVAFSYFYFSDLSYINVGYVPVGEYSYKVYRDSYVSDFYFNLYELDRSLSRLVDEPLILGIIADLMDLPPGVSVTRVGNSVRVAVRSGQLSAHPDLLKQGLDQYTAAVNRYRTDKANEIVSDIIERIEYDRGYRLAELAYVESYLAEGNIDYSTLVLGDEITRLHVQLAQLEHATLELMEIRRNLPQILAKYELTFKNKVDIANSSALTRFKYIIFSLAGLFVGMLAVIIIGFVRSVLAARKEQEV